MKKLGKNGPTKTENITKENGNKKNSPIGPVEAGLLPPATEKLCQITQVDREDVQRRPDTKVREQRQRDGLKIKRRYSRG